MPPLFDLICPGCADAKLDIMLASDAELPFCSCGSRYQKIPPCCAHSWKAPLDTYTAGGSRNRVKLNNSQLDTRIEKLQKRIKEEKK